MYPTLIHEWFEEVWNKGNVGAIYRLLIPESIIHNLAQDGIDRRGPGEYLTFYRQFREAFPDLIVTVRETASEGEIVSGRWTVSGTHRGGNLGFPATNRRVSVEGMSFARVQEGRIVEAWNLWDAAELRKQLGFTSIPPG